MRQLKGKVKENSREKRERKKDFMENKEKAFSIGIKVKELMTMLILKYFSSTIPGRSIRVDSSISVRCHQT